MSVGRSGQQNHVEGAPREAPFEKLTMPEFLTRTAQRFPDRTALVFMGKKISYRELEALVNRFAAAMKAIGVKPGDKVAMLLPNMPQLVIADYAALRIGAVPAPIDPLSTEDDLTRQLNDSGASLLISLDLRLPLVLDIQKKTPIRAIVACHITDYLPFPGNKILPYVHKALYLKIPTQEGIDEFLPLINRHPDTAVENAARWEEAGALLYTGGTTGAGKGVVLTHANISCNCQQLRAALPEAKDGAESILAAFPFFHFAGWTGIQNLSILAGWTDILIPRPDLPVVIHNIKKCKPTILPGLPALFGELLAQEAFREIDLTAVKAFLAGAATLPTEVIRKIKALKERPVINFYGLTEICAMATATPWGGAEKPGTAGVPLPGTQVKIVEPDTGTRELPAGETGEICIQGPQVMNGYHNKPEDTSAVLRDGWLHTGDIGFLDADGYLTIVNRKKEPTAAGR